jgi:hypothetical protein
VLASDEQARDSDHVVAPSLMSRLVAGDDARQVRTG